MNAFAFKPAVRTRTPLLIGLAGQSGAGKTFSALDVATGIGGPIAFIDTERGRGLHYAKRFTFDHGPLEPPFTPQRYMDAIVAAEAHVGEGGTVIVDSMSHEHEGVGGLLEMAHDEAQKMADRAKQNGQHSASAEHYTFPSWREPKQQHQRMVNRMLQLRCNLVLCFRAKEKFKIVEEEKPRRDGRGTYKVKNIVSQGIIPICEENLPYEMTLLAVLHPDEPGVPHWSHKALMEDLRPLFAGVTQLNRDVGRRLAAWSNGEEEDERVIVRDETGGMHSYCVTTAEILTAYGNAKRDARERGGSVANVTIHNLELLERQIPFLKNGNRERLQNDIDAARAMLERGGEADQSDEFADAEPADAPA